MSSHNDKAEALAAKIKAKAEGQLRTLEWEMTKWPAEFRAIMWGAVADIAFKRKFEAEQQHRATLPGGRDGR